MTNTMKAALANLKFYAPYGQNEYADEETYNEIYHSLYKLAALGIFTHDEWMKVVELDSKLSKQ